MSSVHTKAIEIGIDSFAAAHDDTSQAIAPSVRLANLIEEIELADQVGLDVFGIGEHHRKEFLDSAPVVILAAAAARTQNIRLTSAVTVLSAADPVRVFQNFATLDLISRGRAEMVVGRGSFIEAFPLFGLKLEDCDSLFAEKLGLLIQLRDNERVTWSGKHRAAIDNLAVYPRPVQNPLPLWIAVGGNPPSVVRAGTLGLPMALAIIGGMPERFAPLAELHKEAARRAGYEPPALSINSHGYIADTSQGALEESYPYVASMMNKIGRERGWSPMTRAQYDAAATLHGSNFVGTPDQVVEKILFQYDIFHHDRFLVQFTVGTMPHEQVMRAIELLGTVVAPAVREEVARRQR